MMEIVRCKYEKQYDDANQSNVYRLSVLIDFNDGGLMPEIGIDLLLSDAEIASGAGTSAKFAEQFRQMASYIESME